MKNSIDLFRDSFAFKIFVGIVLFLFANQSELKSSFALENEESEVLDIFFQEKFLELNSMYRDHFLTY